MFAQSTVVRLTLLLGLCIGGFLIIPIRQPLMAQSGVRAAAQDTFVDINNTNDNYNGTRLEVTYSNFLGLQPTRDVLLQFDLASLADTFTAETALVITLVENNLPDDASINLALYTAPDQWDEATVTYANRPAQGTQLQGRTVTNTATGAIVFDAAAVRNYLAAEYAGDQRASFILSLTGGNGSLGFAGSLIFEDREGRHDGVNGNEPYLRGVIVVDPPTATVTPLATALSTVSTGTPTTVTPTVTVVASGTATPPTATFVPTAATDPTTPTSSPLTQTTTPSSTATFVPTAATDPTTPTGTPTVRPGPTAMVHLPLIIR